MVRALAITAAAIALISCGDTATDAQARQKPAAAAPASAAAFAGFWTRFRMAALAGDAAQLRALSRATVLLHGDLDDTPARRLPAARVPAAVAAALAAPDDDDAAGRPVRARVQAHARFAPGELDGVGQQRVGPFVFKPDTGGWRLAELYAGE